MLGAAWQLPPWAGVRLGRLLLRGGASWGAECVGRHMLGREQQQAPYPPW